VLNDPGNRKEITTFGSLAVAARADGSRAAIW
jgi:hypothetical protein